ncbi:MAG: DUF429 domain-containing protein [Candidatus Hydrothermarchaeota archaeon]
MIYGGVDLSVSPKNPSGIALLKKKEVRSYHLYSNEDIINEFKHVDVVAIDAPLTLPKGRCCFDESCVCKEGKNLRKADIELISRGYRVFPPGFGFMKLLTIRGIDIAKKLRKMNVNVIETHPRTSRLVLGLSDNDFINEVRDIFRKVSMENNSHHERDAITSSIVSFLYSKNLCEMVGDEGEGVLYIPKEGLSLREVLM